MCFGGEWSFHRVWSWAARNWAWVMPHPIFEAATQEVRNEVQMVWHHIPITVGWWFGHNFIPCCEARVMIADTSEGVLHNLAMRWQSDLPNGSSEATLISGKRRLIPLAARFDGEAGARLTPLASEVSAIAIPPGEYLMRITIVSGQKSWQSPHVYRMFIPGEGQSNGHFNVSIDHTVQLKQAT
jgi:hypothetical protein